MEARPIETSRILADVRYEIRGQLAHKAQNLERLGYEIVSLHIGKPGLFGFRTVTSRAPAAGCSGLARR